MLYGIVEEHVERLVELQAANEASEAEEDPHWADRAAYDGSPAFERHRRYQSAKTRELHRTLDTLRRMRNTEFGTGNEEEELAEGECQMANDECQVAEAECQMAEEESEAEAGGCDERQSGERTPGGSLGQILGEDSNLVLDYSTSGGIEILSLEGTDAADGACQGDGFEDRRACGVKMSQKAPNEPNLESTQSVYSQEFESGNPELQDARTKPILTLPTKVQGDSLGWIGSLKIISDKSLFPMALGSCGY